MTSQFVYSLSRKLPQKRAFITGAASGLGKALCLELAKDRWHIGMADINQKLLETTAREVESAGASVSVYPLDVSDAEAYQVCVEKFLQQSKGIDLLINNAGVGDGSLFEDYSLENWKWMTGINQLGVVYGCLFFVPIMKSQKSGHIINISSAAAFSNAGGMSMYNVTKAAVLSLSESLYTELSSSGIQVSVVMPTFFNTQVTQYGRGTADQLETAKYLLGTSGLEADQVAQTILKKAGKGRLYIVVPGISKFLFITKRLFPGVFLYISRKLFDNQDKVRNRLRAKYEKLNPPNA